MVRGSLTLTSIHILLVDGNEFHSFRYRCLDNFLGKHLGRQIRKNWKYGLGLFDRDIYSYSCSRWEQISFIQLQVPDSFLRIHLVQQIRKNGKHSPL